MAYPEQPSSPGAMSSRRLTNRNTNRYSVTALFSMAAEQDVEVEDDLARGALQVYYLLQLSPETSPPNSTETSQRPQG